MEKRSFDKHSLDAARASLRSLFDAYSAETGIPTTAIAEVVADDRAFASRFRRANLTFATFDRVVARFSWLWPKGAQWPAGVPRYAPIRPTEKAIAKLREREQKQAAANQSTPTLPGDAAWPHDIPKPGATTTKNMEARNG